MSAVVPVSARERGLLVAFMVVTLAFNIWATTRGWGSGHLAGNEFRQTQTAMTAMFVQRDGDYSLAYPTPILGMPWSVPFEFPLYQWTVAATSSATGLPLVQAARAVSWASLLLTLPACWLILQRVGIVGPRRLLVFGFLLTSPHYIYYGRAFLIETMALMLVLWFVAAFVEALSRRSLPWLIAANLAGALGGAMKSTTLLLYLVPVAGFACVHFFRAWKADGLRAAVRSLLWTLGGVLVPVIATVAWTHYADAVKALNPSARGLGSNTLRAYVFGTHEPRFSATLWAGYWKTISTHLVSGMALAAFGSLAACFARGRRGWVVTLAVLFVAALFLFPILYSWHEYYFTANGILLLAALGVGAVALVENPATRRVAWLPILAFVAAQAWLYAQEFYSGQRMPAPGGNSFTNFLREAVPAEQTIIIAGEDWAPMTPFYAQRRALMMRTHLDYDNPYMDEAFNLQDKDSVGALLLTGASRSNEKLVERVAVRFGLAREPVAFFRDSLLYVRPERMAEVVNTLRTFSFGEVFATAAAEKTAAPIDFAARVPVQERHAPLFTKFAPAPVAFAAQFPFGLIDLPDGSVLGAHPRSSIWMKPPAGRRKISASFGLLDGTFESVPVEEATDGVEFTIRQVSGATSRVLHYRWLKPKSVPADRGRQTVTLDVDVREGDEFVFETGPGAQGLLNRDWAYWAAVEIR